MALLRDGITAGNGYVEQIQSSASELAAIGNEIITYLDGNSNFQIFREGTEKGESIYNDLKSCVNTIVDRLVPTIDKISASTSNLLNEQQNLNKAESYYGNEG